MMILVTAWAKESALFQKTELLHGLPQDLAITSAHFYDRQAIFLLDFAHHRQGGFDRTRICFNKEIFEQWIKSFVDFQRSTNFSAGKLAHHLRDFAWNNIRGNADYALSPYSHKRQRQR